MTITYSHKVPPEYHAGEWHCCPLVVFPLDVPDTVSEPIDDAGLRLPVCAVGADTAPLTERLHPKLAERIAAAAQSRGFHDVTPADVQLTT